MALSTDLNYSSASILLAGDGDKTIRTAISGLVKNPDHNALFNVAKAINACQAYSMKGVSITQTTMLTEA